MVKTKYVAFVSAPYRAESHSGVDTNIQCAKAIARELWALGFAVICPHMNSAFFSGVTDEGDFLEGYLEIIRRCDVVVTSRDFGKSSGAVKEVEAARRAGVPVVSDVEQAEAWLVGMLE